MHMPSTLFICGRSRAADPTSVIAGPKACDKQGFEKRQVRGWTHTSAVGKTEWPSDGSRDSVFRCVSEIEV